MKEKQKKQKNKTSPGVVLLTIALVAVVMFGFYAFAKFQSALMPQNVENPVAKWTINFNGTEKSYTYSYVAGQTIAPVTAGHFDIEIQGESETAFSYIVRLSDIKNKPKNLKFYVLNVEGQNGSRSNVADIEANRVYFSDLTGVRINSDGEIVYRPAGNTISENTSFLRNRDLGDTDIELEDATNDIYKSAYTENNRKLEIHWVWPYNNGDGNSVVNGVPSYNPNFSNTSMASANLINGVTEYDRDDTEDSQMGTMSYTVTIVATQKRPEIHTSAIVDASET